MTMVIDTGLGLSAMRDTLDLASQHIDQWKFGFGTTALMPRAPLEAKLALLREHNILAYPGGTLLEAAVVQEHCRVFMKRAAELGFGAAEISEGTIDLPGERRRRMIDCARNAGLQPITEVGRKDPARQLSAEELAVQVLQDLGLGRFLGDHRGQGERDWRRHLRRGRRSPHSFPRRCLEACRRRSVETDLGGSVTFAASLSCVPVRR